MSSVSVDALLEKLRQGDSAVARQLLAGYEPILRRFVRRQLPERLRAKFDSVDVIQSVWADLLRACRSGAWRFPDAGRFQAFLFRVTRNRFIATCRKHRIAQDRECPFDAITTGQLPACREPQALENFAAKELWEQMLCHCAPEHRELLELKRQGLPMSELTARTGLHAGSIRRIFRNLAQRLALEGKTASRS